MTLNEFKAWFDGFSEGMDGPPGENQWERIKARVGEITGNPVTHTYFYDHYWPPYPSTGARSMQFSTADSIWDGASAMNALGRADASVLS